MSLAVKGSKRWAIRNSISIKETFSGPHFFTCRHITQRSTGHSSVGFVVIFDLGPHYIDLVMSGVVIFDLGPHYIDSVMSGVQCH